MYIDKNKCLFIYQSMLINLFSKFSQKAYKNYFDGMGRGPVKAFLTIQKYSKSATNFEK